MATSLPLPPASPATKASIILRGTEAPTPAKKWLLNYRRYGVWRGAHWLSWLPMKGTRRMIWIQWLWGNIRWEGCSAPWDKTPGLCHVCGEQHLRVVHKRLIQCPTWNVAFLQLWTATWAMWSGLAQQWLTGAPDEDKGSISRLQVPTSFVESIPNKLRGKLRERVAWHQCHPEWTQHLPSPPQPPPGTGPSGTGG